LPPTPANILTRFFPETACPSEREDVDLHDLLHFQTLANKKKKMFWALGLASDSERETFACVGLSEQIEAMFS
jgi:hypothetical protein